MPLEERPQIVRGDESEVAIQNQRLLRLAQGGRCLERGVPCAPRLGLKHVLHIVADRGPHGLGLVADHDHHARRAGRARRIHGIASHRPAAQPVGGLRQTRFHPASLTGSENNGDQVPIHKNNLRRDG